VPQFMHKMLNTTLH